MTHAIPFGEASRFKRPSSFPGTWAAIPAWIFTTGVWAILTRKEMAVLGVLARRADNATHQTRANQKALSRESGVTFSSISKATHGLELAGIIKKQRTGNRVTYEIQFKSPEHMGAHYWAPNILRQRPKCSVQRAQSTGLFIGKNSDDPFPRTSVLLNPKNTDAA